MRSSSVVAFFLTALAVPVAQAAAVDIERRVDALASWRYEDCGDPHYLIDVRSIELSPDPPVPGENLTVTASGHVKETIEWGAYADVTVKLGVVKLLHKQFDICQEAENANSTLRCPVESDDYIVAQTVKLPQEIPKAKFTIHISAFTKDEDDLLCLNIFLDLRPFFLKNIGF